MRPDCERETAVMTLNEALAKLKALGNEKMRAQATRPPDYSRSPGNRLACFTQSASCASSSGSSSWMWK